ncbi:thioredoxin domain-containing protein [bacterium]|nr:thioredoxin domain-containing protein [bacterium]
MSSNKKNHLARESSAYLQQHSGNPVDWYPWGKEAISRAKQEQKPIFLSIGYSACHWCHVMEHESFEDLEIADILKKHFISIKVDREERPDLDHIYMAAVQALTHRGGWPLTVFLTPDLKPFYGGTYFPPNDRMGMPSFKKVLLGIAQAWKTRPEELKSSAEELTEALTQMTALGAANKKDASSPLPQDPKILTAQAAHEIQAKTDQTWGGLGTAPKFFHTMDWRVLLRHWKNTKESQALGSVELTLDQWSRGGIFDHLGGGFHRYSTDRQWLVPHFEKMLYDNALIAQLYLEAFQITGNARYAQVVRETLHYVLHQMTDPLGGFYSTEDADSEGVEGKFYTWTHAEVLELLGEEISKTFCEVYDVTASGNWEHVNILRMPLSLESYSEKIKEDPQWIETNLARGKKILFEARNERVRPLKDEKIILAWNGLMMETLAKAHQILGDEHYLRAAQKCGEFISGFFKQSDGLKLHHSFQSGVPCFNAYLDDYAYLINGLLSLFESDFRSDWLKWAEELAQLVVRDFWDEQQNNLFYTSKNHEELIFRPKEYQDGALPSPTGMMITALVKLGKLSGNTQWLEKAEQLLKSHADFIVKAPLACGQMIIAWELLRNDSKEVVIVPGDSSETNREFLDAIRSRYLPNTVVLLKTDQNRHLTLLKDKELKDSLTTAYVCQNQTCLSPITDLKKLVSALHD